jgi:hypothetical protein
MWRVTQTYADDQGVERTRQMQMKPFTQTVRDVCEPCNNEWMSDLEKAAIPLLTPLLRGRGKALHRDGQRILSAWALKTVMVWQESYPSEMQRAIPPQHFRWLYRHRSVRSIKPRWGGQIRLGAYVDPQGPPQFTHSPLRIEPPGFPPLPPGESNGYSITFSVGHAAFHVFGHKLNLQRESPGEHTEILLQLWPYSGQSVTWPPPRLLSAAHMRGPARMFETT